MIDFDKVLSARVFNFQRKNTMYSRVSKYITIILFIVCLIALIVVKCSAPDYAVYEYEASNMIPVLLYIAAGKGRAGRGRLK
jgi:hypothetical protein